MTFTKSEKEIIAYCVSLSENDINPSSPIKKDFHSILGKLQDAGIWGRLDGVHFDEEECSEQLLEEIQDLTETEDGDFRCSTCDQVNALAKDR